MQMNYIMWFDCLTLKDNVSYIKHLQPFKQAKIPPSNTYKLHEKLSSKLKIDVAWMFELNLAGTGAGSKSCSYLTQPACLRAWELQYR